MSSSYQFYTRFEGGGFTQNRITHAVQRLILLNALVFAIQLAVHIPFGRDWAGLPGGSVSRWLAFGPDTFISGFVWQPFTYMFLHASLSHLFMNMLWLYCFGPEVERTLSTRQFYRFYFTCGGLGVMAVLFLWALMGMAGWGNPGLAPPPVVGASGATMGVLIAFAMVNPERELGLFLLPITINARTIVFIVIIFNLISALSGSNVSVATHFGGMAVGYGYMKLAPRFRGIWSSWRSDRKKPGGKVDAVGNAVDNIFTFEEEKRRRK